MNQLQDERFTVPSVTSGQNKRPPPSSCCNETNKKTKQKQPLLWRWTMVKQFKACSMNNSLLPFFSICTTNGENTHCFCHQISSSLLNIKKKKKNSNVFRLLNH